MPQIVIIGDEYARYDEKNKTRNQPRIPREKISHDSEWDSDDDDEFERVDHGDDPVLMCLVEDFLFECSLGSSHICLYVSDARVELELHEPEQHVDLEYVHARDHLHRRPHGTRHDRRHPLWFCRILYERDCTRSRGRLH